jgi:hypothetical protein
MECRSCKRCMFYVPRPGDLVGRCRRHAPTMQGWPVMRPENWCGDYKLNETVTE